MEKFHDGRAAAAPLGNPGPRANAGLPLGLRAEKVDRRPGRRLGAAPEGRFEFVQKAFHLARRDAEKEPAARRKAHARSMHALAEAYDSLDVEGDPALLDPTLDRVGDRNAAALGTGGLIALEPAVDANQQFFRPFGHARSPSNVRRSLRPDPPSLRAKSHEGQFRK